MLDTISNIYSLSNNLETRCRYYLHGLSKAHVKTLCSIDRSAMCLYERIRRNQHCVDLYKDAVIDIINTTLDLNSDRYEELMLSLLWVAEDLSKIHPCAAALAWLNQDINLNSLFDDPFIPTDLNYGLILKCFRPVIRVSNYLAGTGTYEEDVYKFREVWNSTEYCSKLLTKTADTLAISKEQVEESVKEILYV